MPKDNPEKATPYEKAIDELMSKRFQHWQEMHPTLNPNEAYQGEEFMDIVYSALKRLPWYHRLLIRIHLEPLTTSKIIKEDSNA
jgi:hypothetical protein